MPDLLRRAAQWLDEQRAAHMATPVEYRRGPLTCAVAATFGRTEADRTDQSGLTVRTRVQDFLIAADALPVEPEAGDVIAADGRRYEVMPLGSEGPWRWAGPHRRTYRIHTKDVGPDR